MNKDTSWIDSKIAHYEFGIDVRATPERLWRAVTDQIGAWWLPHFHMLGESSQVELELWAGGRLFEKRDDRELLWYTVLAIEPATSLELAGHCTVKYGGPAITQLSLEIAPINDHETRLRVSDSLIGRVTEEFVRSLERGWTELFQDGLKRFVELHP